MIKIKRYIVARIVILVISLAMFIALTTFGFHWGYETRKIDVSDERFAIIRESVGGQRAVYEGVTWKISLIYPNLDDRGVFVIYTESEIREMIYSNTPPVSANIMGHIDNFDPREVKPGMGVLSQWSGITTYYKVEQLSRTRPITEEYNQ